MDAQAARDLIADWLAYRDAAAALLVAQLGLESPRDVMQQQYRGRHVLAGTGWAYRTHGIGVDVTRTNGHGGIDFDFSTADGQLFEPPDFWRLVLFAQRAVHDRNINSAKYATLIETPEKHREIVEVELRRLFPTP